MSLSVPGIQTFHPVGTTAAVGSNPSTESMAALRAAGFTTIVSFSLGSEPGFDPVALDRAATAAGLRFLSIPFDREHPDAAAVRRFLSVVESPETRAVYLACHTGQRAATMWAINRAVREGWSTDRALAEARSLGLARPELERFAEQFIATAQ